MARSRKRFEICIGYKAKDSDNAEINPRNKSTMRMWTKGDAVIVISTLLPVDQ